MIRVVIQGITGKMGNYLFHALNKQEDIRVVAGICQTMRPDFEVPLYTTFEACLLNEDFDILVDFSSYPQCLDTVKSAIMNGKHVVSGTTGYKKYDGQHIQYLAEKHEVGVIISPNYSLSDDYIEYLIACGQKYPYIYISESHSIQKKDKPSGTAKFFARLLNVDPENIHSYRIPNVLASHTVLFSNDLEQLEVTHTTASRDAFVHGIVEAIILMAKNKPINIRI